MEVLHLGISQPDFSAVSQKSLGYVAFANLSCVGLMVGRIALLWVNQKVPTQLLLDGKELTNASQKNNR